MNALRPVMQREPRWECKKLRDSARGMPCTGGSEWCNGDTRTTVWAHSNFAEHGKCVGGKAHDIFGAYLCSACHSWFDTASKQEGFSNDERRAWFQRARDRSLLIVVTEKVLK